MPALLRPDPTFYPSPRLAMEAPDEQYAYVELTDRIRPRPMRIALVDTKPDSKT